MVTIPRQADRPEPLWRRPLPGGWKIAHAQHERLPEGYVALDRPAEACADPAGHLRASWGMPHLRVLFLHVRGGHGPLVAVAERTALRVWEAAA